MLQHDKFVEISNIVANKFPLVDTIIYSQKQIINQIDTIFEEYDWIQEAVYKTSGINIDTFFENEEGLHDFLGTNKLSTDTNIQVQLSGLIAYWSKLTENEIKLVINNQLTYLHIINILYHWMNVDDNINTATHRHTIQHKINQINGIISKMAESQYYDSARFILKPIVLFYHITRNGYNSFDSLSQYGASPWQIRSVVFKYQGKEDIDLGTNTEEFLKIQNVEIQKAKLAEVIYPSIIDGILQRIIHIKDTGEITIWNQHIRYLYNEMSYFLERRLGMGYIQQDNYTRILDKITMLDLTIQEKFYQSK